MKSVKYVYQQNGANEQDASCEILPGNFSFTIKFGDENYDLLFSPLVHDAKKLNIKLKGEQESTVLMDDIVVIESDYENDRSGARTGNKRIYFRNRKPGVLVNFTFETDFEREFHLVNDEFVRVNKSTFVNCNELANFDAKGKTITVTCYGSETKKLKVSRMYLGRIREICKLLTK